MKSSPLTERSLKVQDLLNRAESVAVVSDGIPREIAVFNRVSIKDRGRVRR